MELIKELYTDVSLWFSDYPHVLNYIKFLGVILLALIAFELVHKYILKHLKKVVDKTKTKLDDVFFTPHVIKRLSYIFPLLIIHEFAYLVPEIEQFLLRVTQSGIVFFLILAISKILTALSHYVDNLPKFRDRPVKGYIQVGNILLFIWGGILIAGSLSGESPWTLIGGLSAITAVILLIFRDTLLSFVASIQISTYDLIKEGDWIEVPKFGVDGDVIDISLNVIKVQNFDKTISVVPTYKLVEESFKNWRGMQQSGGRRIKRSIFIDMKSVKFINREMAEKFRNICLIKNYIEEKQKDVDEFNKLKKINEDDLVNARQLTNIGTFRAYLIEYLRKHKDIHNDMIMLVRQLQPGPNGLPLEIYVFTTTTNWVEYENIQSDIFDHIMAITHAFELDLFQNPSGSDFKCFTEKANAE